MHDYQRLILRHRVTLVLATVIGAAAALAYSSVASPTYTATASIQFQDISQQLGFVGTFGGTLETPAQLAAGSSRDITQATILARARQILKASRTIEQLRSDISTSVDTSSNLVLVEASASDKTFAARLANALTQADVDHANRQARSRFRADAADLQRRIALIPDNPANLVTRQNDQANLSRLQTLGIVARPASIAQTADTPQSPAAPKPVFNTVLGGVLGLILGLGIASVRQSLDRRLRSSEEIEEALAGVPILGLIGASVLGATPLAAPADEDAGSRVTRASFGILRRNVELLNLDDKIKTVAVTSAAPDEGKTTVALWLAASFASVGRRTLLVEADLRRPVLADRLELPRTPGLIEYLAGRASPEAILRTVGSLPSSRPATNGQGNSFVAIFAGEPGSNQDELLASNRFRDALAEMSAAYDVIVIDTSPLLPVPDTLEILPLVDAYLVCVREGVSKRTDVAATRAILARLPARSCGGVTTGMSRHESKASGYYDYYSYDRDLKPAAKRESRSRAGS